MSAFDRVEARLMSLRVPDSIRSEDDFSRRVDQDATSFRPMGTKIASYARRAESSKGKGRAADAVSHDDEDAVVYEAYHVRRALELVSRD